MAFAWHLWHVWHLFSICGIGLAFVAFICGSFLSLLWSDERSPTCGSFLSSDERKKQRHSGAGLKMYNVHPLESKEKKKVKESLSLSLSNANRIHSLIPNTEKA